MHRFKDENKNRTLSSLRQFPGENAYELTYYGDYAFEEYLDAHGGTVDEETAFRLLNENHIKGDENYSVIFNLTKRYSSLRTLR